MTLIDQHHLITESLDGTVTETRALPVSASRVEPASNGSAVVSGDIGARTSDGVWLIAKDGEGTEVDAHPGDLNAAIRWDGSKVAFQRFNPDGSADIYTANPDGSDRTRIASGNGVDVLSVPEFSPDGNTIAYWCTPVMPTPPIATSELPTRCGPLLDGTYRQSGLVLMNADGSAERMIVIGNVWYSPHMLAWSPSGRWLASPQAATGCLGNQCTVLPPQIYAYSTGGSDLFKFDALNRQITHDRATCWVGDGFPSFSPDGARLLYGSCAEGETNYGGFAYLVDRQGSNDRRLPLVGGYGGWRFIPPPSGGAPPPTIDETKIVVPKLRGVKYQRARRALRRAHFLVGAIKHRFSVRILRGHVMATAPRGGIVFHRKTKFDAPPVDLVVSRGPRR